MITTEGKPLTTFQQRTVNRLVSSMQSRFQEYALNKKHKTFYWWLNRMLLDEVLLTIVTRSVPGSGVLYLTDMAYLVVVNARGRIVGRYRIA